AGPDFTQSWPRDRECRAPPSLGGRLNWRPHCYRPLRCNSAATWSEHNSKARVLLLAERKCPARGRGIRRPSHWEVHTQEANLFIQILCPKFKSAPDARVSHGSLGYGAQSHIGVVNPQSQIVKLT